MAQKIKLVHARAVDGTERELALVRIEGRTAYVCPKARYREAVENPDLAVGFPLEDVRFGDAA
jgi:hypothetical protein